MYGQSSCYALWGSFTKENPKSDLGSKLGFGVLGATLGTVHEINLGERIKNSQRFCRSRKRSLETLSRNYLITCICHEDQHWPIRGHMIREDM